jgi:hypothetical protein
VNPTEHPNHPKQRFLTYGAPTGRFEQGYAEEAKLGMRAEPECLDENDWDRHIGKPAAQAKTANELRIERDLKLLSQEERIVKAQQEAKAKRRDVSSEVRLLRDMLAKRRSPQKVEKRVQRLEQIAYLGREAA